ncbi:MAG: hypothetical protein WC557_03210, partial [Ignavibacteriaceae bacterium]
AEINFIESSRIEKFVIDTPRSLWDRFLILLGLDDLIQFRSQQSVLKTEAERVKNKAEESFLSSKDAVDSVKEEIAELENRFQKTLGNSWKNILDNSKLSESEKHYKQFVSLEHIAKDLSEKLGTIASLQQTKESTVLKLETEKEKIETPKVAGVINEAFNYFNSVDNIETCPVCENPIKQKDVLQRLKTLKDAYSNIINLEARLKQIDGQIISLKPEAANAKNNFIAEYYPIDLSQKTDEELRKFLSMELAKISAKKEDYFSSIKNSKLEELGVYKSKKEQLAQAELSHQKNSEEYQFHKTVFEQIEKGFNDYKLEYGEKIKQELSAIGKNKVTPIYNKINRSLSENIDEFDIEADIEKEQISFKAKFKDNDKWEDALKILSTGHLRCLGFALLITRLKEKKTTLKFIVIDDPIYSIDHEHRYNLTQYFLELSQDYQLIITTSDRNFFDIIRNLFADPQISVYKTFFSRENSTVFGKYLIKQSHTNYICEAESHLLLNDFRAASLYSRLALETKIIELAKKIKLTVSIDRINRIGIKEIFTNNFKTKLQEKYPEKKDTINTEISKLENHRYFQSLIKEFPLDELVHFPDDERGFIYSAQEIETIIETVKKFIKYSDTL